MQTKIAHYLTEKINKDYGTKIYIDKVSVTIFGGVKLKTVFIKDCKNDTLIYANRINTSVLDVKKFINGKLIFGTMRADSLKVKIRTYKGETDSNINKFIDAFDDGKKASGKFLMTSDKITLTNSRFILIDDNRLVPKDLDLKKLNATISNFIIKGPNVTTNIDKMSFLDHRGLFVENLTSKFSYTKKNIKLNNTELTTKRSKFVGDIVLNYDKDKHDFSDFNNKVVFNVKAKSASIASNDIRYFYKELGKDQQFNFTAKLNGTLNDFTATKLHLKDTKKSEIIGNVNFKNLFAKPGKGSFYMKGNFDKVSSNYENLTALLPNILGKKLPTSLKKLGQFNIKGTSEITPTSINANFGMATALGIVKSNLVMTNIDNIDAATYKGKVILENFDLGTFLNRKDVGKATLDLDVDGKGFTEKYLKTKFNGNISNFRYNNYTYTNVVVNGDFVKPIFNGKVSINDPNLIMNFEGVIDLSKKSNHYDFDTKIDYANLKKLNFVADTISNFKGNINMNVSGNSLDNLVGNVNFTNTSYQNKKETYHFDDFILKSEFDQNKERTISLNAPDVIEGKVVGKFQFNQLRKMLENAAGSLYANYRPNKIIKGQYLKFDFKIYNKIIEIFYPGIAIGNNTIFHGNIDSDKQEFKFNFSAPSVTAYNNSFDNIKILIDNKNPLYNAYIQLDSIKTKYYKVRDFSLINVTQKDTLFVRTEFKGGNNGEDFYNLNLFHTIDKDNKNVVGIKKSEINFKNNLWYINQKENSSNKIVFDKTLKNFDIDAIVMSHENEMISLLGNFKSKSDKDIKLSFDKVDLNKITPSLEKFKFEGLLNGDVNIKQVENVYQPTSSVTIDSLKINNTALGKLNLKINGDDSLTKYTINSSIENENVQAFTANGTLDIVDKASQLDLDLSFDKFNLGILSAIGGNTISNIRGFASGKARINGDVSNLDINGKLVVNDAGLKIPYLGTDYSFENNSEVTVTRNQFVFSNVALRNTNYPTQGTLDGTIQHKNFGDWHLDLKIDSKNLVALDTKDSEDAAYYGKAFVNGNATIKGPTTALFINVDAKSNKGTDIKIPINDSEAIGDSNYIHFFTPKEKYNLKKGIVEKRNYDGLELNFDFNITPDADIEVILNRESGHGMKGNGYGTLNLAINTQGKFNVNGDFQVWNGKYNFKYGGLIDKTFDVKRYGTIIWSGDPMRAELNLEAVYKTQANPGVLLENPSFNKKVPVEVSIGIKGNLSSPEPDFNINFPTVSSVLKSEIQTKLDDKDIRQKQALVLLGTGSFLSTEGINQSSLVTNNLFERASSIFDDLFQDKDSKLKFGLGYNVADKTPTGLQNSGGRFDVNISTQVSDRIVINGKVGVPVGGVNESAVVGNLEIQYRVNEDGTLNLRVFNRENEINYLGEGIGYTQGVGLTYEVDFDTFKELLSKIFKKTTLNIEKKPKEENQDTITKPDFINFSDEKKKTK